MFALPARVQCFAPADLNGRTVIAEGTTSIVESALLHGMPVTVKTLKAGSSIADAHTRERARTDFESELAINISLRHPNIILLLGYIRQPPQQNGDISDMQSLVFEFCEGGVLQCRSFGHSKISEGLDVCTGIARALAFAHGIGIMHRDVKPSQIVLQNGIPKVGDWGLATFCEENRRATGETGTWEFVRIERERDVKFPTPLKSTLTDDLRIMRFADGP